MTRISGWAVLLTLVLMLACLPPTRADYEAGERAWEAGRLEQALTEWRSAATSGDRRAMLALGRLYAQGLGVLQDYVEAHKWFNLAASRGEADAVPERDALASKMTPHQIAAAQQRAAAWQPVPGRGEPEVAEAPTSVIGPPPPRAIREAQELLAALGYAPGPADGIWGERSARAYQAFLRDAGRPASDTLTPEALRVMREIVKRRGDTASVREGAPAPEALRQVPESRASRPVRTRPYALHRAAQTGDVDGLKAILSAGVDVNGRDDQGWTALMHAANKGYPLLVESLLTAQAAPDIRAPDGATALFIAALHGHPEIIELLMEAGADITVRGPKGRTASDVARAKYGNLETARENNAGPAVFALLSDITLAEFKRLAEPFGPNWIVTTNQPCQMYSFVPAEIRTVTWSGSCVDGKASGEGRLVRRFASGTVSEYEGQMRDGKIHGRGTIIYADGNRYEGAWQDGRAHGRGIYTWSDGSRYEGEWRDAEMHGRGTYTSADGRHYEGEWRDNMYHGWGIQTLPEGHRYEGEWRDDKTHGRGTMTFSDGSRYEGQWRAGMWEGRGSMTYPSGDRYEGQWRGNKPHGHGTFAEKSSGRHYKGVWRDGCLMQAGNLIAYLATTKEACRSN